MQNPPRFEAGFLPTVSAEVVGFSLNFWKKFGLVYVIKKKSSGTLYKGRKKHVQSGALA